jgi:C4-dicarboxylate transporter/malic acid transport protein
MAILTPPRAGTQLTGPSHHRPFGLLKDLDRPSDMFRDLGPNWFATVMGTGIVANAGALLPVRVTGLHAAARAVWALAAFGLIALTAAWAVHWIRHRDRALAHAANPVMAQFWGAPAMALMTVGSGTVLLGRDWIGLPAAVDADWVLWGAGTALGLFTTVWIPYLMMIRHSITADSAFGGWLMPVVPPMVSAATGALLIPHLATAQGRLTMLLACYAMFGISLIASMIIITLLWSRLVTGQPGPAVLMPTMWIVLGPLGQSVTAAGNLAGVAGTALPRPYPAGAAVFALLYGVPAWGFAMFWLVLAAAVTVRTARQGLPFGLTWWSFTFPVGTCVTGTISLAARTHSEVLRGASVLLFALLAAAWLVVAARTAAGSARGRLFLPGAAPTAEPAPAVISADLTAPDVTAPDVTGTGQ